ncbi:hypothetical protein Bbelb_140650 [Branchiostoma belcheri]|nr:hypothetical protein Bbelb_140650 [Branchiostoma belcheri]
MSELPLQTLALLDDYFKRGIKEAIYIRALQPSLNRDRGRYRLQTTFDPLLTSHVGKITAFGCRPPSIQPTPENATKAADGRVCVTETTLYIPVETIEPTFSDRGQLAHGGAINRHFDTWGQLVDFQPAIYPGTNVIKSPIHPHAPTPPAINQIQQVRLHITAMIASQPSHLPAIDTRLRSIDVIQAPILKPRPPPSKRRNANI